MKISVFIDGPMELQMRTDVFNPFSSIYLTARKCTVELAES